MPKFIKMLEKRQGEKPGEFFLCSVVFGFNVSFNKLGKEDTGKMLDTSLLVKEGSLLIKRATVFWEISA